MTSAGFWRKFSKGIHPAGTQWGQTPINAMGTDPNLQWGQTPICNGDRPQFAHNGDRPQLTEPGLSFTSYFGSINWGLSPLCWGLSPLQIGVCPHCVNINWGLSPLPSSVYCGVNFPFAAIIVLTLSRSFTPRSLVGPNSPDFTN
jgi:hypothetical protein